MIKRDFRVAAAAAVSIVALAAPALANHSWNGYHWNRPSGEVTAPVVTALSGQWPNYVDRVVADWNQSNYIQSAYDPNTNSPAVGVNAKTCKAIAGKILVCNAKYGLNGWLGIASIWLSNGHISQGTTKLNDSYYAQNRYNTPAWRRMVFCQEVGHTYGLGHVNENFNDPNEGTCMDYTNDPARDDGKGTNQYPNQHDYDELATIYAAHGDVATATNFAMRTPGQAVAAASPGLGDGIPGDTPAQWGRAVHRDGLGRPDVFEMDLGSGNKKITHVFWTLETRRVEHEDH